MSDLNTRVAGDVGSVRATANGMSALGNAIEETGAGFGSASTQSESLWTGMAGDAFRGRIGTAAQATAQVAASTRRMTAALHTFADRMTEVHDRINKAKSIATAAGLHVSGDTIKAPTPPPPPPVGCFTPPAAAVIAHDQAVEQARYQRQLAAFTEAEQLLSQARTIESTAHRDVAKTAADEGGILADLNKNKFWLSAGAATGALAGGLEQRAAWLRTTQKLGLEYDRLRSAAQANPLLRTEAQAALSDTSRAADATVSNARLGLGVNPASGLGKVISHLPAGLAAAQGLLDVANAHGTKAKVVAATADAAGFGAGEAVTALGSSALEGLAIGGAPETLGLSLVAGGVAYGTGYLVQHYGPAIADWTAGAVSTVGDAVTHPGRTLDDIGNAIGGLFS